MWRAGPTLYNQYWNIYLGILSLLVVVSFQNAGGFRTSREVGLGMYDMVQPRFLRTNNNITVGPGDRAVLKCRVENLGTRKVTWRKKSEAHPLTIGLFTFVGDTRITMDYNQRTNEWSLIIQDVKPSDEGIYQCQISTKHDNLNTYDVRLNVKTVQVSGTGYVELNGQIQLICNATGKPDPPHDVQWFKDGVKINSDARSGILITKKIETKVLISVLVINNSRMKHAGEYVCMSSNRQYGDITVHVLNVNRPNSSFGRIFETT